MIADYAIKAFTKHWQGPALTVLVGRKSYTLGQGTAHTKVIFKSGIIPRLRVSPSLAFGEGYMSGDVVIEGELMDVLQGFYQSRDVIPTIIKRLRKTKANLPTGVTSAIKNARHHYDLGNDFYSLWLDRSRTYSCAYFLHQSDTLDQAQAQKNDLICRKIRLQSGQTLLDIGAGWGSTLFHAAEHYGAKVTGITPAKEQASYIRAEAKRRGLQDRITVINKDWRSLSGQYDRIISIGMFEHVGRRQYQAFLHLWRQLLVEDGISLLHTIGHSRYSTPDPWISKYIFPGGYLPQLEDIALNAAVNHLHIVDVENMRRHYALTLSHWSKNFAAARERIIAMLDEQFARRWWLYLQASEAGFRWGDLQLYQVVILGQKAKWPLNREVKIASARS